VNPFGFIETAVPQGHRGCGHRPDSTTSPRTRRNRQVIAQANAPLDAEWPLPGGARPGPHQGRRARPSQLTRAGVEYMDVSPRQNGLGPPPSLIPFLEHDDANRGPGWARPCSGRRCSCCAAESPLSGRAWSWCRVDAGDVLVAGQPGVVDGAVRRTTSRDGRRRHPPDLSGGTSSAGPTHRAPATNQKPIVDEGQRVRAGSGTGRRARVPRTARWPSVRTCSWRSCRGRATTTRRESSLSQRCRDDVLTFDHRGARG